MRLCPDHDVCCVRVSAKKHQQYCLGKEYSPLQCGEYEHRHPPIEKTPRQWGKPKPSKEAIPKNAIH